MRRTFYRFESPLDNMFSRLCQYLNRHIIRDQIFFDQCPHKTKLCLRCCRKTNLNLLEADFHEQLKKFHFLFQTHRFDQRLISISQIHTAPDRRMIDIIFLHPVITSLRRHKICTLVFLIIFHPNHSLIFYQYSCLFLSSTILSYLLRRFQ